MKRVTAVCLIVSALFSTVAVAQDRESLPEDAYALSPLAGKVVRTYPLCPEDVICVLDGTGIDLSFDLTGCMDQLVGFRHEAIERDGELHVYVSASNVHTESSLLSFCAEMPTVSKELQLIDQYGEVVVHFLGTGVKYPPEGEICGALQGFTCPEGQYCDLGIGQCEMPDAQGTCKLQPEICTKEFNPVCGCDGKTYGNACEAAGAGVSINYPGECV